MLTPVARTGLLTGSVLLLLSLLAVFGAGLAGPFLFDDYPNLLGNATMLALRTQHGSLADVLRDAGAGPLGRPLAVLTLAWQYQWFGPYPLPYKVFNLAVHFLNAWLVWRFAEALLAQMEGAVPQPGTADGTGGTPPAEGAAGTRRGTAGTAGRRRWALAVALLWALHPLTVTSVLYVVQRMTSLATLFMLLALWAAVAIHTRLAADRLVPWPAWAVIPVCGVLAVLCKESGVLLVPYLLVLDQTLLRTRPLPAATAVAWRRGMRVLVYLPLLAGLLALPWVLPALLAGFADRDFTLPQRLLTEARIFWLYLRLLVLPEPAAFGLYHDDVALSLGWWQPASTAWAVAALAGVSALAWWGRRRTPWWSFAWGFLLASQVLESTVVPLELMHEHRLYLGMLGPILALAATLRTRLAVLPAHLLPGRLAQLRRRWTGHPWGALVLLPLVLGAGLATANRAASWRNPLAMMQIEVLHHPRSVHATYDVATLYGELAEGSREAGERRRLFALAVAWAARAHALDPVNEKTLAGWLLVCSEAGCTPPGDAFARLQALLRTGPRADLMAGDVQALLNCVADGSCHFAARDLLGCLEALHTNPRVSARAWALVSDAEPVLRAAAQRDQGSTP